MPNLTLTTIEVSRGATHDGPGMRTTVFTKGCPLCCCWCQNPESIGFGQEVWYEARKCIGCLECVKICPKEALNAGENGIEINRGLCDGCGACAEICPSRAITAVGTIWNVDELVSEVLKDEHFYGQTGGGVTVSGGEPLIYADFLVEFCKELKSVGIHTALDTCGCVPRGNLTKVLPYLDLVLFDIKLYEAEKHKEFTGRENQLILENLKFTAEYIRKTQMEQNRKIGLWIRTPLIPVATSGIENLEQIAEFININISDTVDRWELCAFNSACAAKYARMQKEWPYGGCGAMEQADIEKIKAHILSRGFPADKLMVTGLIS